MNLRSLEPESSASANSATLAFTLFRFFRGLIIISYTVLHVNSIAIKSSENFYFRYTISCKGRDNLCYIMRYAFHITASPKKMQNKNRKQESICSSRRNNHTSLPLHSTVDAKERNRVHRHHYAVYLFCIFRFFRMILHTI